MTLSREQMLTEMGITPLWVLRETAETDIAEVADNPPRNAVQAATAGDAEEGIAAIPNVEPTAALLRQPPVSDIAPALPADVATLDWEGLLNGVAACRACELCKQRKQAVPGVGDLSPDWLFIGEGPGAEEDARGEPFVGQAGKLLDNMLASLEIVRGKGVYIANAVKCRPPGNRTPEAGEMAACRPWLLRQIELLKPRIIVLLGKAAVHSVLHEDKPLAGMRGRRHEFAGIPVVVTYHPAYLLRNLPEKAKAWEDLVFARKLLREAKG